MNTNILIPAFLMGLLGSGHCFAMCGGIASAFSLQTQSESFKTLGFYNLGRLLSYGLFGAITAGLIQGLMSITQLTEYLFVLRYIASFLLILLALHLAKIWHGITILEKAGKFLWQFICPLTRHFLPLKKPFYALPFGMLWGWLPCGLVYSALSWASTSANPAEGFSIMLAFGIGTLPSMFLLGSATVKLKAFLENNIFRFASAFIIMFYGLFSIHSLGAH